MATPPSFQSTNLRGRSFQGQDLRSADFSHADIRGANFANATLVGANFSYSQGGLRQSWLVGSILAAITMSALAGFISGYASGFGAYVTHLPAQHTLWERQLLPLIAATVLIGFLIILLRRGLGGALATTALVLGAVIAIVAAVADVAVVATMLLLALAVAAAMAGILLGAVVVAFVVGIGELWSTAMVVLAALIGAIPGILESVQGGAAEVTTSTLIIAAASTLVLLAVSGHIGRQAMAGDRKYFLIWALVTALFTRGGTAFRGADLTDADFSGAILKHADLREADLTRTCWFGARQLDWARTERTYLAHADLAALVTSKQGRNQIFDHMNLRGLNLAAADLTDASFIGTDLSEATLEGADLSRAKLVQAQFYHTDLSRACLTGAYIENWGISTDTLFDGIKCEYVYMRLPTPHDPDPFRKPDNRQETFGDGDFENFIAPIIKTLDLYRHQGVDPREVVEFKPLDLFHREGVDATASAIALQQLAERHPEVGLEVVALEGRGNEKIRLQAKVAGDADRSQLSEEYLAIYNQVKSLSPSDVQALLATMAEKDERIRSLEQMVLAAVNSTKFYAEAYYNLGDTVTGTVFDQHGQVIQGPQTNVAGGVEGDVYSGAIDQVGDRQVDVSDRKEDG